MADRVPIARLDNRLNRLVNIGLGESRGERGDEPLFEAARAPQGGSLVGAEAGRRRCPKAVGGDRRRFGPAHANHVQAGENNDPPWARRRLRVRRCAR